MTNSLMPGLLALALALLAAAPHAQPPPQPPAPQQPSDLSTTITGATIFKPSGTVTLDTAALRAVLATRTLPPLPDAFPNPTLTMRLSFEYQ